MILEEFALGGTRAGTGNEVFGIDLGTTYSSIAWLDENGKAEIIANREDERTTPSVVFFENETKISVGQTAKEQIAVTPEQVCSFVKREMGNPSYRFKAPGGQEYSPVQISAMIVKKLVQDTAERTGCEVKKAIITCPAYFGSDEHKATKEAGEAAGLEVLQVINEPTAAAIAYGIKLNEPKTIVVYDLGGGTFDVTVLKVSDKIEPYVTGGDARLGGKDWDMEFAKHLAEKWQEQTNSSEDLMQDELAKNELLFLAEKWKKKLSTLEKVRVPVTPEGRGKASIEVTREDFDTITSSLLERTMTATKDVLADAAKKAGVDAFEFDELIMVGSSSKMPQVEARLRREFGDKVKSFEPADAVAKGAAIFASLGGPDPVENILSKSYGVVGKRNGQAAVFNMLLKNERQTDTFTHKFPVDRPNLASIDIQITESETGCWEDSKTPEEQSRIAPIDDVIVKNKSILQLKDGMPAGEMVDVTFAVDQNMVLNVTAAVASTGEKIDIKVEGVTTMPKALCGGLVIE